MLETNTIGIDASYKEHSILNNNRMHLGSRKKMFVRNIWLCAQVDYSNLL